MSDKIYKNLVSALGTLKGNLETVETLGKKVHDDGVRMMSFRGT